MAQVPQQAVGQAQHRELEEEYVYFCHLGVFFINCGQAQGRQPFICLTVFLLLLSLYRQLMFYCIFGSRRVFMVDYVLLTLVTCIFFYFVNKRNAVRLLFCSEIVIYRIM